MNKLFNTKNIIKLIGILFIAVSIVSCQRDNSAEEDDLPQEDLTNIILLVKDVATQVTLPYNYSVGAGGAQSIKLENGKTYEVEVQFKNGNEDATQEIKDAKDEHFLVYNFPNSDLTLTRTDDASSTRGDGKHVGLKTKWVVTKAVKNASAQSQLILTLYHEPATVSEASSVSGNGIVYGAQTGGETDAQATYTIIN
ncbi:hypothetical protein ACNFU2_09960 [Chryseobacterium sp. PTM-20240506]|uniref:hypothetical protein n=1 Tax=unclassified Chryseobacterium TaxID=2593645 RepID=UPI00235897C8|nr:MULTISPECIES: hypothetical protein [unclassified Chryseobacterium]MDC8105218.1 hypothetical protein [Chryseobacterium sp. B21-037]MDQ1805476.1 hypothetical protein [Chryseobacterium sp. CKR4-1]